ncbi:MAG: glycoside hydrolase family 9 protein [Bacteroidia bacterium]
MWVAFLAGFAHLHAVPDRTTPYIRIDQFGYQPWDRKVAVVADPVEGFNAADEYVPGTGAGQYEVRRWTDDAVVLRGTLAAWGQDAVHLQSGDLGWYFDFSALRDSGSYYIFDTHTGMASYRFEIGPGVYRGVLGAALRMFFYQRINFPKEATYAGAKWADGPAFEGPMQEYSVTSRWAKQDPATARDLHGGWYDAGDPNKYVTFTVIPVICLTEAYRQAPAVFTDDLDIPESGNGVADLLDELKWELDWIARMQDATGTGGLLLKMGVDNHDDASPPSLDRRPRYYYPECSSSTIAGAAMFASAGLVYRSLGDPALQAYGDSLVARAVRAFDRAHTQTGGFARFDTACDDGDIKAGDADRSGVEQLHDAVVAAVYLYEALGTARYRDFVEAHRDGTKPFAEASWSPYTLARCIALSRYASLPGVPPASRRAIRQLGTGSLRYGVGDTAQDLYRAHLDDKALHRGSNSIRAGAGGLLLDVPAMGLARRHGSSYRDAAAGYLHYLHGVNPMGLVYLTNMYDLGAEASANEMFHTWFCDQSDWDHALHSALGPPPGYLVGGPNRFFTGKLTEDLTLQPPGKAYKDWNSGWPENSWEITEPAIYYQAAYIYLLTRLMQPPRS